MPHDLFKFTTGGEDSGPGGSVGTDHGTAVPRAAISLDSEVAAQERDGHLEACIFMKVAHELLRFTTVDENAGGPRFVGAAVAFMGKMRDEGVPSPI